MLEEKQKAYVKDSLARAISEMKVAKIEGRKLQCVDDFINEIRGVWYYECFYCLWWIYKVLDRESVIRLNQL